MQKLITILFIIIFVFGIYWYVRGMAYAILSKQRMCNIMLSNAYEKLSSPFEEIRKLAPRPSMNVPKIFTQILFWPFYRKTNKFYLKASEEEVLTGIPTRYY